MIRHLALRFLLRPEPRRRFSAWIGISAWVCVAFDANDAEKIGAELVAASTPP
jgi:hypothetical protein